jgi:pilus assembly protein CpaC
MASVRKRLVAALSTASHLLALLGATAAHAQPVAELALEVSEQRVIPSAGVSSYSEGAPGIVDVRLTKDGGQFVIVGQRAGVTSLLFVMSDGSQVQYRITVTDPRSGPAAGAAQPDTRVGARDNVRLDFYFVQLSSDEQTRVGVAWPAVFGAASLSASYDLTQGSLTDATATVTDQALPRLDFARAQGWAKLLRQAAVITANGTEATFTGGGELNLPVESALSVGVRQIAFGSSVRVQPRYDRDSGRIELVIHAEVSDLASDHGSGLPGRVISTLDTVVNLELGQSLVLAGLTAQSQAGGVVGLPWLSQIPILGALFGSNVSRAERSENLVFIVPTVADSASRDARERVREALEVFRDYDGDLDEQPLRPDALAVPSGKTRPGGTP